MVCVALLESICRLDQGWCRADRHTERLQWPYVTASFMVS